jgi:L-fuconolactonase
MNAAGARIDAHQHFWKYSEAEYPWIPKGSALHRDWLPDNLAAEQAKVDLHGSIAVQARQSLDESRWLLKLADAHPVIRGVVGWVDLRSQNIEQELGEFAKHPKFVGVRHVVQDEPDDRFMLQPDFLRGIGTLRRFGLTYDILIFPKQLPAAIELVARFPEQPFVLDHIAKPLIKNRVLKPWSEHIRELASAPNLFCKVSGMVTEADHATWKPDDLRPYLDLIFEVFGPDRLMFGSDWPVCLLAASYEAACNVVNEYAQQLAPAIRDALFGGNALRFYGIET